MEYAARSLKVGDILLDNHDRAYAEVLELVAVGRDIEIKTRTGWIARRASDRLMVQRS